MMERVSGLSVRFLWLVLGVCLAPLQGSWASEGLQTEPVAAWREGYRQVCLRWEEKAAAERFFAQMEQALKRFPQSPLAQGYHAAAGLILANHGWSPLAKWQAFTKYRDQLERAIARAPGVPDLKLIRLGIQRHAPSFLGYSSAIDSDTRACKAALQQGHWGAEPTFQSFVRETLSAPAP